MKQEEAIQAIFLQEAREHLETLSLGLSNINITVADHDQSQEIFRAFFCLKGGTAILGFSPVYKIVIGLEDCFRMVRDNYLSVDSLVQSQFTAVAQVLENLFTYIGEGDNSQLAEKSSILLEQLKANINHLCQASQPNR